MESQAVVVALVSERNEVGARHRHLVEVELGLRAREQTGIKSCRERCFTSQWKKKRVVYTMEERCQ